MYTLDTRLKTVELVRNGMSYRAAGRTMGISHVSIWNWHHALDGETKALYDFVYDGKRIKKARSMDLDNLPDNPNELKQIIHDMQFELDVTNAVVDILKKDPGVDPKTLSRKDKAILIDALAKKSTRYTISYLTSSLHLAPATFYYQKKKMGKDPEKTLRATVKKACAEHPMWGYRRIKILIDDELGGCHGVSEKRIRRIMREESLLVPRRRKYSRYSSYDPRLDTGEKLPNVPLKDDGTHDFSAPSPNTLWLTDVTEFLLPSGQRIYLSPVLDCYDSSLRGWEISTSSKADDLTNPSLKKAVKSLRAGERCVTHTDKGGQYFSEGWKKICEKYDIGRSMSRKGHSPDNARMEGFFGRLKMEFFDIHDWTDVSVESFMKELDSWLVYYNEKRPKHSLGWISPMQYRRRFYGAA